MAGPHPAPGGRGLSVGWGQTFLQPVLVVPEVWLHARRVGDSPLCSSQEPLGAGQVLESVPSQDGLCSRHFLLMLALGTPRPRLWSGAQSSRKPCVVGVPVRLVIAQGPRV